MPADYTVPMNPTIPFKGFRSVWAISHALMVLCLTMTLFAMLILAPFAVAATQTLLLRDILGRARGWAIATFLGVLLGYATGGWLWIELDSRAIPGVIAIALVMAIFGLSIGLPQWWVLRQSGGKTAWRWILASVIGWAALGAIYALAVTNNSLLIIAGYLLLAGACYGIITGPVLLSIVQRLPQAVSNDQVSLPVPPL